MKVVTLDNIKYTLEKDYKNGYDLSASESLETLYTDYFHNYDYILGDWSYGKLRLKGFCEKQNKMFNKFNNIEHLDKYLKEQCAYECKYFLLKKIKEK